MARNLPWFRMYNEILDDEKVQALPAALGWLWVNFLAYASLNDGHLPNPKKIAWRLRIDEDRAKRACDALVEAGLLHAHDDGFIPHNWEGRQYKSDSSTSRVQKLRENRRVANPPKSVGRPRKPKNPATLHETLHVTNLEKHETLHVTVPDTDTDTDTETDTEKKETSSMSPKKAITLSSFSPTEADTGKAIEAGVPIEQIAFQTEQWRDYHAERGTAIKDYSASWRRWMRNAPTMSKPTNGHRPQTFGEIGRENLTAAMLKSRERYEQDAARELREGDGDPVHRLPSGRQNQRPSGEYLLGAPEKPGR